MRCIASKSVKISITTTPQVVAHLKALLPLGLYGHSVSEVAERLICEQLRIDLKRSRQSLLQQNIDNQNHNHKERAEHD